MTDLTIRSSIGTQDSHLTNSSLKSLPATNSRSRYKRRLPKAIIIGSRKSGTRALLKFLELNPSVRAAHSEVHFFDDEHNYAKGLDWYRQQMPETREDELAIEKSPAYFVTDGAAQRIREMDANVKMILIMRNPVTRLISDFSQLFANRFSSNMVALNHGEDDYLAMNNTDIDSPRWDEASEEFRRYVLRPDGGIAEQRRSIRIGMYSNYIEKWRRIFPMRQIHFVDGEQLISNPYDVMRQVERFLGLEPHIKPEQFVYNPKKGFYCLRAIPNSTIVGENEGGGKKLICLSKNKGRRHVNVSKELLAQLEDFYSPYNAYLFALTGINFNKPKQA